MMATATLLCPECGEPMMLKRHESGDRFWGCPRYPECQGYCGAHPDGRPLGTPGDIATRQARHRAHQAFDALWNERRLMTRGVAYRWLAIKFGVPDAHIGAMNAEQCDLVVQFCEELNPANVMALDEMRQAKSEYEGEINERRFCVGRRKHRRRLRRARKVLDE